MIRDANIHQPDLPGIEAFQTPFGMALDPDNRWVQWAAQIPWAELGQSYHASLSTGGRPAKPARLVIGALIIKHRLKLSDVETIEQLRENPYLQYFCGFERYQSEAAFVPTLFVKIRERLTADRFAEFEQAIIDRMAHVECGTTTSVARDESPPDDPGAPPSEVIPTVEDDTTANADGHHAEQENPSPQGTLIIDASVAEQQIRYPQDVALLNTAREQSEQLIDALWAALHKPGSDLGSDLSLESGLELGNKPRSYRQRARRDYLRYSKKRQRSATTTRRARRQQLQYLRRNLGHLDQLLDLWPLLGFPLPYRQQRQLWVIRELYRQQLALHQQRSRRIDHRIVSLHQPQVRPIVRGRLGHPVEFGAKFSVGLVNGIACVDALRWDAYHEAADLIDHCQAYQRRHGHYPAKVLADGAYGTRANRSWLKEHNIAFGGKPLGRPPKLSAEEQRQINAQRQQDACDRIPIEGKFGQGKSGYGLNKIKARRPDTSEAWIRSIFFVMNLLRLAKAIRWARKAAALWSGLCQWVRQWMRTLTRDVTSSSPFVPLT